jgi:hypothetical protein
VGDSGSSDTVLNQVLSTPEYGVFPPLDSLKVYKGSTDTEFRVSPGVCVLPFTADLAGNTTEARAILAAINGTYFSGTLTVASSGTRTDLIYAKASTAIYSTTLWERASGTAKVTTSAAHGFRIGDTVTVTGSGVTSGSYTITAVTSTSPYTFSFADAGATQASIALSPNGKAYVPFSIGVVQGSVAIPSGTIGIPLASVTVNTTGMVAINPITDLRQFVAATGGIHYREANSVNQTTFNGKVQYNVSTGALEVYDRSTTPFGGTAGWRTLYKASTGHHDSVVTDASDAALHHTLGTGQYQAAKGNHTHAGSAITPTNVWATTQGTIATPAIRIGSLNASQEYGGIFLSSSYYPRWSRSSSGGAVDMGWLALYKEDSKKIKASKLAANGDWTVIDNTDTPWISAFYKTVNGSNVAYAEDDTLIVTVETTGTSPILSTNYPLSVHIVSRSGNDAVFRVTTGARFTVDGSDNILKRYEVVPTGNVTLNILAVPNGQFFQINTSS